MALSKDISILTLMLAQKFTKNYVNDHSGTASAGTAGTVTLGTSWSGSGPYTQNAGTTYTTTEKTVVDIQPNVSVINQLAEDGVSQIIIENNNATLTAYAFGAKPTTALTLPVLFFEVS